jgi:hypothetical protein
VGDGGCALFLVSSSTRTGMLNTVSSSVYMRPIQERAGHRGMGPLDLNHHPSQHTVLTAHIQKCSHAHHCTHNPAVKVQLHAIAVQVQPKVGFTSHHPLVGSSSWQARPWAVPPWVVVLGRRSLPASAAAAGRTLAAAAPLVPSPPAAPVVHSQQQQHICSATTAGHEQRMGGKEGLSGLNQEGSSNSASQCNCPPATWSEAPTQGCAEAAEC